jgi:hypothetical protein
LHPVIEYSLELPYGRQARIWVTTETACYRIMSVSANYISYWQPFYEMVCFAGHVVNVLLNYTGPIMMVKLVGKVAKLSGKELEDTYESFKIHRKFIQDLLKDQNLSAKIRKEYNALQSNPANWENSWDEHLKAFEKKKGKKEKVNILSFFRSKSDENSVNSLNSSNSSSSLFDQYSKTSTTSFDDTSSLLSISEDESATYIEFPYETLEELEPEKSPENCIKGRIGSSFTSSGFLEWKLPECESLKESYYTCPLCKITFKTGEKDCISAFSVHLRAHRADCEPVKAEFIAESDFENRFSSFRTELHKLIVGKVSCDSIPLKFEKRINEFSANIFDRPFTRYAVLESEEIVTGLTVTNPIRILKFSANIGTSPAPRPSPSTMVPAAAPVPKKPRVKKPPAPKALTTFVDTSSSASSSACSSALASPIKSLNNLSSVENIIIQSSNTSALTANLAVNNSSPISISSVPNRNRKADSSNILSNNQESSTSFNNSVHSPSNVLSKVLTAPLLPIPVSRALSPLILAPAPGIAIASANSKTASSDSKSIINLDRNSFQDWKIRSDHVSPLNAKRPFSAVPVPIEIFSSEELVVTPPVPGLADIAKSFVASGQLGCSHYMINCKFYAECCGKWFFCRFCHDNVSDHKLNRHETRFCLCLFCGTSQNASRKCCHPSCQAILAHYYCDKCKFWDNDPTKSIYHCDKCGICRTGLKQSYSHCDRCGKCVSNAIFSDHKCIINLNAQNIQSKAIRSAEKININVPAGKSNVSCPIPPPLNQPAAQQVESTSGRDKSSADQTNYVNYLKNSLAYWRNKGTNTTSIQVAENAHSRNCWNCMNSLPSGPEGAANSKYCLHCSAIIE